MDRSDFKSSAVFHNAGRKTSSERGRTGGWLQKGVKQEEEEEEKEEMA